MAEDNEKQLDSLREIENAQKRIDELLKRQAMSNEKNAKKLQERINKEQELIKLTQKQISEAEKQSNELDYQAQKQEEINDLQNHFSKLSKGVQTQLTSIGKGHSAIASVSKIIVDLKKKQLTASQDERTTIDAQASIYQGLRDDVVDLAKHQVKKKDEATEEEKLRASLKGMADDEIEQAVTLLKLKGQLVKKHERLHELQHQLEHVIHHLPEPIREAAGFAGDMVKNFGKGVFVAGLLAAGIMAGLHAFLEMDEAAAKYKETTGFTNNMTKEIDDTVHHTGLAYRGLGVTMADAYDVMSELANSQSDMFTFAQGTSDALSLMKATMGISAQNSAAVQASFEQIGGLSEATAANTQMMAAKLAEGVGVSPAEMFADMSKSAGVLSKHMKGNVQLFIQSAAKAKMLGTSLEEAGEHAEKLLDFESGIEDELVAATFVGGQFNLSRARALAYEGDILGAQQATLDALEQSGDFTKKDYHTKMALAKAAGMEVEEIEKQLGIRDKLGKMGGDTLKNAQALIKSGVDISEMDDDTLKKKAEQFATQQKIASQMDEFKNAIAGSVEQIGGRMLPAFQAIMPVLVGMANIFGVIGDTIKFMGENTWAMIAGLTAMSIIAGIIVMAKLKELALEKQIKLAKMKSLGIDTAKATASIWAGGGGLGPVGWGLAAAAVLGMLAMIASATKKGDDVFSPGAGSSGYGSRTLLGPEGAIQLNNKDSVIAGTDLFSKKQQPQSQPTVLQTASPVASSNNNMISALINEFRGVRADMASGKIGVYMDNDKVTASVTKTAERSTRNNFALQ
jgi:hypothetical protein